MLVLKIILVISFLAPFTYGIQIHSSELPNEPEKGVIEPLTPIDAAIEKCIEIVINRIDDEDDEIERYYTIFDETIFDEDDEIESYYTILLRWCYFLLICGSFLATYLFARALSNLPFRKNSNAVRESNED